MQETWVWFLGEKDPLDKEMATTLVLLPGESDGQSSLVGYESMGVRRLRHDLVTEQHSNVACGILIPRPQIEPIRSTESY